MENKIAEEFKILYEQWEQYIKARFASGDMYKLSKKFLKEEIDKCKSEEISENQVLGLLNIRNAHTHSSEFLEIKEPAIVFFRKLVNIFCKKAKDIAISKQEIYKVNLRTKVCQTIKEMDEHLYTHVPVIQEKVFYGVFSENTLLKIVSSRRWNEDLTMNDVVDILKIANGVDDYKFLSENASFYDVYKLFQKYIDRGKRLGVIFLTNDGQEIGDIKGLITAWDLHKGTQ